MDVYLYKAALWCGPCIIKTLVAERKAAPGAIDMLPAEALEQRFHDKVLLFCRLRLSAVLSRKRLGQTPTFGQRSANAHSLHIGLRAKQTWRP